MGNSDAFVMGIDIHAISTQKADERLSVLSCKWDGQVGRRGDGGDERQLGSKSFGLSGFPAMPITCLPFVS
jgi:hypothetical protein